MSFINTYISCDCGQVKYKAKGQPIVTAVCYCVDCQAAGDIIEKLENVKPFREADGGTPYVTLKDADWVAIKGADQLQAIKLKPKSPTSRFVTRCCQTPLFIKYRAGFWTSTYRARYDNPPPIEWRNKISARQSDLDFEDDVPRYKGFPLRLIWRLLKARLS